MTTTTQTTKPAITITQLEPELTGSAYEQVIARALAAGRIDDDTARRMRYHVESKQARQDWPVCVHGTRTGALDDDGNGLCVTCWQERRQSRYAAERAAAQEK